MKKSYLLLLFLLMMIVSVQSKAQTVTSPADTSQYPYWIQMMQDPDANFYSIQSAFNKYWENRPITKGCGWKPFKRWESMMKERVSPDGKMPAPDAVMKAYNSYIAQYDNTTTLAGNWISQGPFAMGGGYQGLGRINAIACHPIDPEKIFIGTPAGGLWRTSNGGNDWSTTTDMLPTLGVSAIVIDPADPLIMYIGTGDRDGGDAPGMGVMKSSDGGETWQLSNNGMGNKTVGRLLIDYTNSHLLYAATTGGLYKSVNAGQTWVMKTGGGYKDAAFKPGNTEIIYATQGGKFYRSADAGETWTNITSGIPSAARGVIAVTPAQPEYVYFLLAKSDNGFRGLYRSTDGGLTFTEMSSSPNIMDWSCDGSGTGGQAWYDLSLAADPVDANIIYVGGVNVWRSLNGGATWQISGHWYGGCGVSEVHADQHILEVNPVDNRIFLGNDGGIYYTSNSGVSWNEITTGLAISEAYKLGQSATIDDLVVNGYQDNGTSLFDYDAWISIGGGDGMECAIDPTDPMVRYTTIYYGAINRVTGTNARQIAGNGVNGITEDGAWVTPFIIAENDPNTMFIGYKNIWRSTNIKNPNSATVTWKKISAINTSNLSVLEQSPVNPQILYTSSGGSLFLSTDALDVNPSWINISSQLASNSVISDIEASPVEENTVYVTQDKKVFKSENKGATWTDISGGLPSIHYSNIVYYKNSLEGLYVCSDAGVYYKDNSMADWVPFSNGLPASIKATEVEIYYDPVTPEGDRIKVSTFGRGMWKSDMYSAVPEADFTSNRTIIPSGCPINFTDMTGGIPSQWHWSFAGANPSTSEVKDPAGIVYTTPGKYDVQLTATNASGSNSRTKIAYITVSDTLKPLIGFEASPIAVCDMNTIVQLTDTTKYCPGTWSWTITPSTYVYENGTSASSQNPQVRFTAYGGYTITLEASNTIGTRSLSRVNYIVVGGYKTPYSESFEGNSMSSKGWTIENPDNYITWGYVNVDGNSPGHQAAWINFFNYSVPPGRRDRLISPPYNFIGTTPVFMTFEHAYANRFTTISDSLVILVSDDCGSTWTRVFAAGEKGEGTLATVPKQLTAFTPVNGDDWCGGGWGSLCNIVDLTAWAGKPGVRIAFESYNRNGNNLYLDNIEIAGTPNVGIQSLEKKGILIYPNPASGIVTLYSQQPTEDITVSLINIQGSVVFEQAIKSKPSLSETLNLAKLAKGVYLIKISGNHTREMQKLILK